MAMKRRACLWALLLALLLAGCRAEEAVLPPEPPAEAAADGCEVKWETVWYGGRTYTGSIVYTTIPPSAVLLGELTASDAPEADLECTRQDWDGEEVYYFVLQDRACFAVPGPPPQGSAYPGQNGGCVLVDGHGSITMSLGVPEPLVAAPDAVRLHREGTVTELDAAAVFEAMRPGFATIRAADGDCDLDAALAAGVVLELCYDAPARVWWDHACGYACAFGFRYPAAYLILSEDEPMLLLGDTRTMSGYTMPEALQAILDAVET